MTKIKQPSVAGSFYSADPNELKNQIENFAKQSKNHYQNSTRAVIVPHAGLIYSGRLAYEGISQLDKTIKNIFIFAPAHRVGFDGLALSSFDSWNTPLGNININQEINNELKEKFNANFIDEALAPEHAIEIQVPTIQTLFENVSIIPILIGKESPHKIKEIIEYYYPNKENGFVISSDLSHFLTDEKAKQIDTVTAQMIESGNIEEFQYQQACGALGIVSLSLFSNENNYSLIRIDMENSSSTTGDKNSVVGYGCWFLYEGKTNDFLKKYYTKSILDLCKIAIKSHFVSQETQIKYPQVFNQLGASFVTLEKNNHLRGCIGSIIAHRSLILDIVSNAQNAAFKDPRFNPVEKDELDQLQIAVSILSEPKKMKFKDEDDLLNQMRPNIDGIIIKDKGYQAVYLPSVWEQLPDKKEFLNTLKMKAGLSADYFSDTFEAYRFETAYIK